MTDEELANELEATADHWDWLGYNGRVPTVTLHSTISEVRMAAARLRQLSGVDARTIAAVDDLFVSLVDICGRVKALRSALEGRG